MAVLARSIGYMIAFIVGAYVEYTVVPFIYIGLPIIFLALFLCLPNTAPYLIRNKKYEVNKNFSLTPFQNAHKPFAFH